MTGISGWCGEMASHDKVQAMTTRMLTSLPGPGNPRHLIGNRGAVGGRLESNSIASDSSAGLIVAIDGAPRWRSREITDIADSIGNGAALISAYKLLGMDLFEQISGPFALAILDDQSGEVVLAVDRMGIRPLCYARMHNNSLVFASTAKSILAHGQIDDELSAQSIYSYVYFHVVPSPSTIFDKIYKLEPSQCVVFKTGSLHNTYYWTPQFSKRTNISEDALQQDLMQNLRSAVARTCPDENTGAFLSGGLDSSTVCGLANEIVGHPLAAYSIGFGQEGYDEIGYARIAASHFGLQLREYYVTPEDVAEAIPIIARTYDEPFGNSSAVPAYFCARIAHDDGIQRLLAGDGGDELFAGNERYAKQRLFEHYNLVPGVLRKFFLEPAVSRLPTDWSKLTHKLRRYIEQARVTLPERLQTYNYLHMNDPAAVFDSDFLDMVDVRRPILDMETWYARGADFELVDRMLMFDWKLTLADNDIRKVNRMCGAVGIGVDYPLLDDDLVTFSTGMPSSLKLTHQQLRYFFKRTVDHFLPVEIINKQKHGFGLPFGEWLTNSTQLQDIVEPSLNSLNERGILRQDFISRLLKNHKTVHAAFYGNIIWVLVMLEQWLQANSQAVNYKH